MLRPAFANGALVHLLQSRHPVRTFTPATPTKRRRAEANRASSNDQLFCRGCVASTACLGVGTTGLKNLPRSPQGFDASSTPSPAVSCPPDRGTSIAWKARRRPSKRSSNRGSASQTGISQTSQPNEGREACPHNCQAAGAQPPVRLTETATRTTAPISRMSPIHPRAIPHTAIPRPRCQPSLSSIWPFAM